MKFGKIIGVLFGLWFFPFLNTSYAGPQNEFRELTNLADKYGTDKGSTGHRFTEVYEYFFYPMKDKAKKILEIGVEKGASLKMFREYFPNAVIYGIDIADSSSLNSDSIKTFIADQSSRKQLSDFIAKYGGNFDVILDDGGHLMNLQQVSFGFLFKFVRAEGYYVIEDVHTSLRPGNWGVEMDGRNSTIFMIDNFIRNGGIYSKYMTPQELIYLNNNIEYSNLLSRNKGRSITCIFKKKK